MARERAWVAVRVEADPARHQKISEALFAIGAGGVQEEGGVLITHFPPGTAEDDIRGAVRQAAPTAALQIGVSPDVDWSEAWKHGLYAHELGKLTVAPPWLAAEHASATTVIIEPGTGFGTGEHPTTRSVIRLMQRVLRPGDIVADLGSGSGILSIAAAKLGASRAIAIEMDDDSNQNAAENIELNGVGDVVTLLPGDASLLLPLVAPIDLVVANIISSVLLPLMPIIRGALRHNDGPVDPDTRSLMRDDSSGATRSNELTHDARRTRQDARRTRQDARRTTHDVTVSHVVLAGILTSERTMMLDALKDWTVVQEDVEGDWWAVLLSPK